MTLSDLANKIFFYGLNRMEPIVSIHLYAKEDIRASLIVSMFFVVKISNHQIVRRAPLYYVCNVGFDC